MPYPDIYPPDDPDFHPTVVAHNMFVEHVDRDVADTIVDRLAASDAPVRIAQLRVLGGAMARVPADATAFAHRSSPIMANWPPATTARRGPRAPRDWVRDFAAALDRAMPGPT